MDNFTFYIFNFNSSKPELNNYSYWEEYIPKFKELKKPIPKEYHYFKKRLYNDRGKCSLFLSLRYDDIKNTSRLRINGSLKNWYFGENSKNNLTRKQYMECIKKLSKKIGVETKVLIQAKITKIECGVTVKTNSNSIKLIDNFIWYKSFERIKEKESTLYFRGKFYDLILYDKLAEIIAKSKEMKKKPVKNKPNPLTEHFIRFEVKVKKVSGIDFYKRNANTVGKIIKNWDKLLYKIQSSYKNIEYVDIDAKEKEVNFKKLPISKYNKYLQFKGIKEKGLYEVIDELKIMDLKTNITKYRNEKFNLFRSHVNSNVEIENELSDSFQREIINLMYNKSNIYSNINK